VQDFGRRLEGTKSLVGNRRAHLFVFGLIAACLHDDGRTVRAAEMADVFKPVAERLIAEEETAMPMFRNLLGLRYPDRGEDGAAAHEQGVGAVINVLSAEIPDLKACCITAPGARQRGGGDDDAVRRFHLVVIVFAAQPAADLCLSHPPVAENHELDVRHAFRPGIEITEMGA